MKDPLVTILVPTYRRPSMLRRALVSVIGQTRNDFIVCILDNASDDGGTERVAREFTARDARFRYIRREKNIGGVENLILGLRLVETKYFSYLADDDIWMPEFLEKAVFSLEKNEDAGFFGATCICVEVCGAPYLFTGPAHADGFYPCPESARVLWERGWPQQAAVLYRSEALKAVGEVPRILGFDLYLLTAIALKQGAVFSAEPLAFFTINPASASSSRNVDSVLKEWLFLRDAIAGHYAAPDESKDKLLRAWEKRMPGQIRMMTMLSLVRMENGDAARGVRLMRGYGRITWSGNIIGISVYLACLGAPVSRLISTAFRYRMKAFTFFRKSRFFLRYRLTKSGYWLAYRLTKGGAATN